MAPDADPLTTAELDALDALNRARTPGLWRWWTSNSMRRLSSDPSGCDGDVAHAYIARDGVPDISITMADMDAIAAALNALPALLAEVRAARLAAVEVRAVATALAEHEPCMACGCEDQEDSCLYHESHELSARLLAALDGKGASK